MKVFKLFAGKTADQIEKTGDAYFQAQEHGAARLEYERALDKLEKKTPEAKQSIDRVREKVVRAGNALALDHRRNAEELRAIGDVEEAEGLLRLALELTQDKAVAEEIEGMLRALQADESASGSLEASTGASFAEAGDGPAVEGDVEGYFTALVSTLPRWEQEAYVTYGEKFREGYVKLNEGRFEEALECLAHAFEDHALSPGFIPLELATAHLNLGNEAEALELLEDFLAENPDSFRAYQLLCEVYWNQGQLDAAQRLLLQCPEPLRGSAAVTLLLGETLFKDRRYNEAEALYMDYVRDHPWEEGIGIALARTFEKLGSTDKARDLYAQAMNACQGCGRRVDPFVKQRYADTSLETGDHSTRILEVFLALVQENPESRTHNYEQISRIYELNGNRSEAGRFRNFADRSRRGE